MSKCMMIGCDLHDSSMVLTAAVDDGKPFRKSFDTWQTDELIRWMKDHSAEHGCSRIVFAYEASARGFGLHDTLTEARIECYVLAPTHLPRSVHRCKNKTDEKDAKMILEEVRAHVLAGRKLPAVWVPSPRTRDDREIVRTRLGLARQRTQVKNQIRMLAKRWGMEFPPLFTKSGEWSKQSIQWLRDVARGQVAALQAGGQAALASLIDLHEAMRAQLRQLDKTIEVLAQSDRYSKAFGRLRLVSGVGTLTAMTFLTELGNLDRFANRRQLAAYLGLVPQAFESGDRDDRKGHITHQGSARIRHVLCQAAWAALRCSTYWREMYDGVKRGTAKRTKIAIVAVMRRLAITMWQAARSDRSDYLLLAMRDPSRTPAPQPEEECPPDGALPLIQVGFCALARGKGP